MYGLAVNLTMSVSGHPSIINEMTRKWLQMLSRRMRNVYDVNCGSLLSRIVCILRSLLEGGVDIPFGFCHDGEMIGKDHSPRAF